MTGSAEVFSVFVLVARTLSPTLTFSRGIAAPEARRTFVPAVNDSPPHVAASARSPVSSAALSQCAACKRHVVSSSLTPPDLLPRALDRTFRKLFTRLIRSTFDIPILVCRTEISGLCSAPEVPA